MKTKEEYLKKMKIGKLLPKELSEKIRIKYFSKGEIMEMGAFVNGNIWHLIKGSARVTIYNEHKGEYYGEFMEGEWIGVAGCLIDLSAKSIDIEAKEDVIAMVIPLKDAIDNYPEKMLPLWQDIAEASAKEFSRILGKTLSKALLSNEDFFLNYLKENNLRITYKNTRELSEILNTNLRTLQRILRKLTDEGIIKRSKNEIWVIDEGKLEEILVNED